VRALCVVEPTPLLDDDLRCLQGIEDFSVEEFIFESVR
jgi:hypothetical protein